MKANKAACGKPDAENPVWNKTDFEKAKRVEGHPCPSRTSQSASPASAAPRRPRPRSR